MKTILSFIFLIAMLLFGSMLVYLTSLAHWALGVATATLEIMFLCLLFYNANEKIRKERKGGKG